MKVGHVEKGVNKFMVQSNVCSVCSDPSKVTKKASVTVGDRVAKLDLCDEHLSPLLEYMLPELVIPLRQGRKPTRRRIKVTSMEEIQAAKLG